MSTTNAPALAVILPTNRWDIKTREILAQAATIGCDDILVHIGDNSRNAEKQLFLEGLAARSTNVVVTCYPEHTGADENWQYLLRAQTAEYFCMAADDDCYTAGYFRAALDLIRSDPTCSAAAGLYISVAHPTEHAGGATDSRSSAAAATSSVRTPEDRLETDALGRIREYRGENTMCYAISKRAVIADFFRFTEANPLRCPFNDVILAFHLLSIGTYRIDRRGYAYVYDHTNWRLNDTFIQSNKRWYKGYGLPEGFGYLTRLHMAVVAAHFFSSRFRSPDLDAGSAEAIAAHLFCRIRAEFADDFHRYRSAIDALFVEGGTAAAARRRLMTRRYDRLEAIFDDFALVVAAFSPEVARLYRDFQGATLHPRAAAIRMPALAPLKRLSLVRAAAGGVLGRAFG